ncbi:MAG: cadherin repeat domain-containing protein, partial [Balneolales bacterium]|nr:cadherin repeat domain-containing protein [Balneolales bacterium]
RFLLLLGFLITFSASGNAQTQIAQDYSNILEIPNVKTIQASTSHLYVLSELEGMAVFRVYGDSLQWLYTSSGMQRRGDTMDADIRFAYLYGDSKRLTVLEPTSVLGVYSSTLLPEKPLGVARLQNYLFVAMGSAGLGQLSLETPETVDSDAQIVGNDVIIRAGVLDVISSIVSNQLFVVTDDQKLHSFSVGDEGLEHIATLNLSENIHRLFIDGESIWGSTASGEIFTISANGVGRNLGNIDEPVSSIAFWNGILFTRGESGRLWVSQNNRTLSTWKNETLSGNFITKSKDAVWISVFDKLSSIITLDQTSNPPNAILSNDFSIKPIESITLTFPKPLLLGLELEGSYPTDDVTFTYRSGVNNATINKQGFFWQPTMNQV